MDQYLKVIFFLIDKTNLCHDGGEVLCPVVCLECPAEDLDEPAAVGGVPPAVVAGDGGVRQQEVGVQRRSVRGEAVGGLPPSCLLDHLCPLVHPVALAGLQNAGCWAMISNYLNKEQLRFTGEAGTAIRSEWLPHLASCC